MKNEKKNGVDFHRDEFRIQFLPVRIFCRLKYDHPVSGSQIKNDLIISQIQTVNNLRQIFFVGREIRDRRKPPEGEKDNDKENKNNNYCCNCHKIILA